MPPETFLRTHFCGLLTISTRRRFFLAENFSSADFSKDGAAITSRNNFAISSAAAASTGIDSDHATESGDGIALECALVGFGQRRAGCGSGGIGVFDDRAERLIEFLSEVPGGLQVNDVV